jgi:hypothetical protein
VTPIATPISAFAALTAQARGKSSSPLDAAIKAAHRRLDPTTARARVRRRNVSSPATNPTSRSVGFIPTRVPVRYALRTGEKLALVVAPRWSLLPLLVAATVAPGCGGDGSEDQPSDSRQGTRDKTFSIKRAPEQSLDAPCGSIIEGRSSGPTLWVLLGQLSTDDLTTNNVAAIAIDYRRVCRAESDSTVGAVAHRVLGSR